MSHRFRRGLLIVVAASLLAADGFADSRFPSPSEGRKLSTGGKSDTGDASVSPDRGPFQQARELARAGKHQEALPLAQKAVKACERRFGPDDPRTAGALQLEANIYLGLNQNRRAIPLYQRALAIREKALGLEDSKTAETLAHLGKAYIGTGDYAKALPLLERSLETRKRVLGAEHRATAESLNLLAELHRQMGNMDKALPLAQQSLAIRERILGAAAPETAHSLVELALIYQQQGAADKALPLAERAVKIWEKELGANHPKTAQAQRIVGLIHTERQDYAKAEATVKEGQRGKKGTGIMIEVYMGQGRFQQALELLSSVPLNPWASLQSKAQYYTQKGQALQGVGRLGEAAVAFGEAIRNIEDLRDRSPGERTGFFQGGRISAHYKTYLAMIGVLADMAQKGEPLPPAIKSYGADPAAAAFYVAESIKARSLLEAIAAKAGTSSSLALPADLVAREQKLRGQLSALDAKREDIFQPHAGRKRDIAIFQAKLQELQDKKEALIKELRQRYPRYAALYYPRPYKTEELPLKSGEILLEYSLGEKESYLFQVEPGGRTHIFRLPWGQRQVTKRLEPLVAPFRQSHLRREDLGAFSLSKAAALFRDLLAPGLAGVSAGTRVIIVPDGILGAFPFEALVVEAKTDWGQSLLVGDRWLLTYCQSAAILALNRHLGLARAPQPLFALGDCIYEKTSPRYVAYKGGQGKAGELQHAGPEKTLTMSATGADEGRLQFPPLPETRQTVMELAALFQVQPKPPQVLLDVLATETRVRQTSLSQYRYLFFGTHGFLADNLEGVQEPTLVLSQVENKPPDNGFLTFHKVLQLKLDADLVTLAACMTGVGRVTQGEGVLNFARAFQQAGARSVMVALWNIPVEESLKFYRGFYKALKEGRPKLEALKAARQSVRAKEPHPYFWAGLILHGEG
jgi:hypothetical protein